MNDKDTLRRNRQALVNELTQAGGKFKGNYCTCPFHEDHKPSAGVYCKDGIWRFKCQACGVIGDIFDIKARNEGKPVADVLKTATERYSPQNKDFANLEAVRGFLRSYVGKIESEYTYTDSQDEKTLMVVFRCWTSEGKTFRPCYPANGRFVLGAPSVPRPLYNLPGIAGTDTVVVCEGEKCCNAMAEYGVMATTSPGGAKNGEYADWSPLSGKNVVLWPDNDDDGRQFIAEVERQLQNLEQQPRISILDPASLDLGPKEDVADYLQQLKIVGCDIGRELQEALRKARPRGIAASVKETIENAIEGRIAAISWPWEALTHLTKSLRPGSITLLCGSAGASKSFMLLQALAFWLTIGVKVIVYELEETRSYHLQRCLAQKVCIGDLTDLEWIKVNPTQARQAYDDNSEYLESIGRCLWASPESQPTLEQLSEWISKKAEGGYRIICADPVTLAVRTKEPYIGDPIFLRSIGRAAEKHSCSIVLVTHPVKTVSGPDMSQIAGGAAYSRHSQAIAWLESHDPKTSKVRTSLRTTEEEHNRTLHILKARDARGTGLRLAFQFEKESLKARELGIIMKK